MKVKKAIKLFRPLFFVLLLIGCKADPHIEVKESYNLSVSPANYTFPAEGGELEIEVTATKTITTISEELIVSKKEEVPFSFSLSGEGFSLVPNGNKILAGKNEGDERSATLTVIINETDLRKEIRLSQRGKVKGLVTYVAPVSKGKGNGESADDAADFMDPVFWQLITSGLTNRPVEVKFLAGDYSKAYKENGLVFSNIGNESNRLTFTGGDDVIFTLPEGLSDKSDVIRFNNCQNIHIRGFHFTGNGRVEYTLRITGDNSKNFLIENCSWLDMGGIIFGCTGAHQGASHINYKNCVFKRIGINAGSHMMYHSYRASYIGVFDCHFEDCRGDYVRFRARTDFGIVKRSTFIRNVNYPDVTFIAIPCFNDVNPGDEWFGTNFAFTSNRFENKSSSNPVAPVNFFHQGYSPRQFNYLLTESQGNLLVNGSSSDKIKILNENFGIIVGKIRIANNTLPIHPLQVTITSRTGYGAVSLGWTGTAIITDLISTAEIPFDWEFSF